MLNMLKTDEVLDEINKHSPSFKEYEGGWRELSCRGCDEFDGKRLSALDWKPHDQHRSEIFHNLLQLLVQEEQSIILSEAAGHFRWNGDPDECTIIYDPYDVEEELLRFSEAVWSQKLPQRTN